MNFTDISDLNHTLKSAETTSASNLFFSETEAAVLVLVTVLLASAGILLNLLLILSTTLTDGFADAPANVFVLSLACTDLLVCCVSAPFYIYNCYRPIITIFVTVSRFNAVATTGNIFLLSLNRFVSIVKDLKYPNIMTFKRTIMLVGIIWFVAFIVTALAVVGLIWEITPIVHLTRYFIAFYVTLSVVMHVYMYKLARDHRKQLKRQAFAVTGQIQDKSDEFRALRSLFMISGSFAACWLPLSVESFLMKEIGENYNRIFLFTCPLCAVNSILDAVIYYFRSKGFRASLHILVRRMKNSGCC